MGHANCTGVAILYSCMQYVYLVCVLENDIDVYTYCTLHAHAAIQLLLQYVV